MTLDGLELRILQSVDKVTQEARKRVGNIAPEIRPFLGAVARESIHLRSDEWREEGIELREEEAVVEKTETSLKILLLELGDDLIFTLPTGQKGILLISVLEQMRRIQLSRVTGVFPFCFWQRR